MVISGGGSILIVRQLYWAIHYVKERPHTDKATTSSKGQWRINYSDSKLFFIFFWWTSAKNEVGYKLMPVGVLVLECDLADPFARWFYYLMKVAMPLDAAKQEREQSLAEAYFQQCELLGRNVGWKNTNSKSLITQESKVA
jgi:hypothetical protein